MRNLKAFVAAMVIGCVSTLSTVAIAEDKIAVVDIARAIFSSNLAQQRLKEAETGADFCQPLRRNMRVQLLTCNRWPKKLKASV